MMNDSPIPRTVLNWIGNHAVAAQGGAVIGKCDPVTGKPLCQVTRSQPADAHAAIHAARNAFPAWAAQTVAKRGDILRRATIALQQRTDEFARIVHLETGKSMKDARG